MTRAGDGNLRNAFRSLARGRTEALETVWRELARPLHHYALALTNDQDEADDILSDTLVKLSRIGWRLQWVRNPRAYLFAAVRNAAHDQARRREQSQPGRGGGRGEPVAADETAGTAIRVAVWDLPPEQREVVVLHIWGGLTFDEIGRTTGIPANTAASRYRYGLQKLRQALGETRDE